MLYYGCKINCEWHLIKCFYTKLDCITLCTCYRLWTVNAFPEVVISFSSQHRSQGQICIHLYWNSTRSVEDVFVFLLLSIFTVTPLFTVTSMSVFCSCREECFCGLSDLIAHPQRLGDMSMTWDLVSYEALTNCHKPVDPILWRNLQPKLDSVGLCHCGELNALFELATAVVLKLFFRWWWATT